MATRGPVSIMLSVWKALFLREASFRLFGTRGAWAWLLIEPLAHFAFLIFIFSVIRQRSVGGIPIETWLIIGLFGFFIFRRTANQMGGAIDSNRALFTYRQVLPFDAIIVRGFLEAFIMMFALFAVTFIMWLFGFQIVPDDPARFILAMFGLWSLGASLGLLIAIMGEVASESRNVLSIIMLPLYFMSAVIFPIMAVPPQYRVYLLYNPIIHGLEAARSSFATFYHAPPEIDLGYLYTWVLCFALAGLILYRTYSNRIVAQ